MSTEVEQNNKDRVEWYRGKVQELSSQGYSQSVLMISRKSGVMVNVNSGVGKAVSLAEIQVKPQSTII